MGCKQALVVRSDLKMGKGKIAAQCSHATLLALDKASEHDAAVERASAKNKSSNLRVLPFV